jgi:hypothetical protein
MPVFSRSREPERARAGGLLGYGLWRPRAALRRGAGAGVRGAQHSVRAVWRTRRGRRVVIAAGGAVLVLLLAAAWGAKLASERPAWFERVRAASLDDNARRRAVAVENRAVTVMTTPRPAGERWSHELGEPEANAWLGHRLRGWFEREHPGAWPSDLAEVAVDFRSGEMVLGLRFTSERSGTAQATAVGVVEPVGAGRVVSVRVRPSIDEAGDVRVRVIGVGVNRLPLPAGSMTSALGRNMLPRDLEPELVEAIVTALSGAAIELDPTRAVDRDRAVTVHALSVEDEAVRVVCSTGPRGGSGDGEAGRSQAAGPAE